MRNTDVIKRNLMLLTALAAGAAFFVSAIPSLIGIGDPGVMTVSSETMSPDEITVSTDVTSPMDVSVSSNSEEDLVSGDKNLSDISDIDIYLTENVEWTERKEAYAFDAHVLLEDKKVIISSSEEGEDAAVWRSDDDWQVQDFIICDIDHDGEDELLLLVWKHGNFGEHKPFFVEENDNDLGQHIFIFSKRDNSGKNMSDDSGFGSHENSSDAPFLRSEWMSSAMHEIVSRWEYSAEDGLELVLAADGTVRHYAWQEWGLKEMVPEVSRVRFIAFGDMIAHEQIWRYAADAGDSSDQTKEDYGFLFENVKYRIDDSDITAIVQETPLAEDGDAYRAYPDFASPAGIAYAERDAGFDVIACATNHMLDEGAEGIERMLDTYGSFGGVTVLGIGKEDALPEDRVSILESNGIKIAFADYTYGTNGKTLPSGTGYTVDTLSDEERIREDLLYADENADVTIVFVHWGNEYDDQISEEQEKWTEVFYECGVDAVIGSHPHVLQRFEMYEGEMPVFYSLGNFVSGQDRIERVLGGMASFTIEYDRFNGVRVVDAGLEPVITHQEARGIYTAYLLRDYDMDLADRHRLDIDIPGMWRMYDDCLAGD